MNLLSDAGGHFAVWTDFKVAVGGPRRSPKDHHIFDVPLFCAFNIAWVNAVRITLHALI